MPLSLVKGKVGKNKKGYKVNTRPNSLDFKDSNRTPCLKRKAINYAEKGKSIYQKSRCPAGQTMPISSVRKTDYAIPIYILADEVRPINEY